MQTRLARPDSIQTFTFSDSPMAHYDISAAVRNWQGISAELLKENLLLQMIPGVPVIKRHLAAMPTSPFIMRHQPTMVAPKSWSMLFTKAGGTTRGLHASRFSHPDCNWISENGQPYDLLLPSTRRAVALYPEEFVLFPRLHLQGQVKGCLP